MKRPKPLREEELDDIEAMLHEPEESDRDCLDWPTCRTLRSLIAEVRKARRKGRKR